MYKRQPLKRESLLEAIRLNGAAVDGNLLAFELGRYYVYQPNFFQEMKVKDIKNAEYTFESQYWRTDPSGLRGIKVKN